MQPCSRLQGEMKRVAATGRASVLLRDLQAATVLADISAWIGDPATALPSGADRAADQVAAKEPESKQVSGATAPLLIAPAYRRAPVAQLDRALASGAKGLRFDPDGRAIYSLSIKFSPTPDFFWV